MSFMDQVTPDYAGRRQVTAGGRTARGMSKYGRYGDTMMAHVTPGEIVVPKNVQTPRVVNAIGQEMTSRGINPSRYVVGSGQNSINPTTSGEEHFSLGKALGKVAGIAGKVASVATGNPLFALGGDLLGGVAGGGAAGGAPSAGGGAAGGGGSNPLANLPPTTAASIAGSDKRPAITRLSAARSFIPDAPVGDAGAPAPTAMNLRARRPGESSAFDLADVSALIDMVQGSDGSYVPEFYDISSLPDARANSMNPSTGKPEFYVDEAYTGTGRNQRELDIQGLGYSGPFGRGAADQWLQNRYGSTDIGTIRANQSSTPSQPSSTAAPTSSTSSRASSPSPATSSSPASTAPTSSKASKIGNDGYYDFYKPGGDEIRVNRIAPGENKSRNAVMNINQATGDDLVYLSDGRVLRADQLKTPSGFSITANSIVNPDNFQVIGTKSLNSQLPVDYYYPGYSPYSKPAAAPAPVAAAPTAPPAAAPAAPSAPVQSYYDPKYLNELIGREIGYQGPWGAGGMEAWLNANPQKRAEMNYLLTQRGGQRALSADDLSRYGQPGGALPQQIKPTTEEPQFLRDLRDRVNALQQQLTQAATPAASTTPAAANTNTPTAIPEEPIVTRVSSLTPTRGSRFSSRRYKGNLARNF